MKKISVEFSKGIVPGLLTKEQELRSTCKSPNNGLILRCSLTESQTTSSCPSSIVLYLRWRDIMKYRRTTAVFPNIVFWLVSTFDNGRLRFQTLLSKKKNTVQSLFTSSNAAAGTESPWVRCVPFKGTAVFTAPFLSVRSIHNVIINAQDIPYT